MDAVLVQPVTANVPYTLMQLRNTLRQLSVLQLADDTTTVQLRGWQWDAETAAAVADGFAGLPHLRMGVHVAGCLTDAQLGTVLAMGPCVRSLSVGCVRLRTEQWVSTQWPWDELVLGQCEDVGALLRLPSPAGRGTPAVVKCVGPVTVTAKQVSTRTHARTHAHTHTHTHTHSACHVRVLCRYAL